MLYCQVYEGGDFFIKWGLAAVLFHSLSTDFVACKFVAGMCWFGGSCCDWGDQP